MKISRIAARGRTTIPKSIREAAGLYAGHVLAFETEGEHVVVRKVAQGRNDHLKGLNGVPACMASRPFLALSSPAATATPVAAKAVKGRSSRTGAGPSERRMVEAPLRAPGENRPGAADRTDGLRVSQ